MSKFKAVIFDCDGVLVDSEAIGTGILVEMANEYGANIDLAYGYQHFKGSFIDACIAHIENRIGKELPLDFESEYRRRSFEGFKEKITPITGIESVLDTLEIPFGVASSGPPEKIRLNLGLTGLLPRFEGRIYSCYDIGKWKPDPAIFLYAADQLGVNPQDGLVIEDSPQGVSAALAGGFTVFGYRPHQELGPLGDAHRVFDDMSLLPNLIQGYHG